MAFIITRLCRDKLDTACADECPVDCIYVYAGPDADAQPRQLLINPYECVDCGLCVPACPWDAIFPEETLPAALAEDVAVNARCLEVPGDYRVAEPTGTPVPATPDEVAANRRRWGLS